MSCIRRSLVLIVTAATVGSASALPLNSFVQRPVANVGDLLAHVRHDEIVADRYSRHFAMDRATVLAYLSTLRLGKLPITTRTTVYSVPKGGSLKMSVQRLRKGEKVFVDPKGKPILVLRCGNPMVLGPNRARKANPPAAIPGEDSGERVLLPDNQAPEGVLELAATSEPSVPEVLTTGSILPQTATDITTVATGATQADGSSAPWIGSMPFLLPLLVPTVDATGSKGGGPVPTPVPEPASMVALGLGALAIRRRGARLRS